MVRVSTFGFGFDLTGAGFYLAGAGFYLAGAGFYLAGACSTTHGKLSRRTCHAREHSGVREQADTTHVLRCN
jgi:hypothetical protein